MLSGHDGRPSIKLTRRLPTVRNGSTEPSISLLLHAIFIFIFHICISVAPPTLGRLPPVLSVSHVFLCNRSLCVCDVVGNASKESFYGVMLAKFFAGGKVPYLNKFCFLVLFLFLVNLFRDK